MEDAAFVVVPSIIPDDSADLQISYHVGQGKLAHSFKTPLVMNAAYLPISEQKFLVIKPEGSHLPVVGHKLQHFSSCNEAKSTFTPRRKSEL